MRISLKKKASLWFTAVGTVFIITGISTALAGPEARKPVKTVVIERSKTGAHSQLDLSEKYQPNFSHPHRYSREEMKSLAREVLTKMRRKLGARFNREDPQHVRELAEFFSLTPLESLDPYSTPMIEPDIRYFSEVKMHRKSELYPQNTKQLIIRFYWEGLARIAAAHYKLEIVDERGSPNPKKTRGKVSDVATTAMFNKKPGISVAEAMRQERERYDFARLIRHLKDKGLPARSRIK